MEEGSNKLTGVFEGYLKKRKTVGGLTLFNEYTKRYFMLNLEKFEMVYFKNRKKKGKPSVIPLREMLVVHSLAENGTIVLSGGKEWGCEFRVCTRSRTYQFNAYSWSDKEVWINAFYRLMDYK
jgi:hypothetical protein